MTYDARAAGEAMDGIYRYQRHIYDATRRYFLFGRDEALMRLAPPRHGKAVEIGCGTGRNLVHACRLYPDVQFFGLDVSGEMLATAGRSLQSRGLGAQARLALADGTSFSLPELFGFEHADRILVSYVLSMIADWPQVVDRATAVLAPAGELHIVDFGRMDAIPAPLRKGLRAWLAHFGVTPREQLRTVGERAAARHGRQLRFYEGRYGYAAHAIIS